MELFLKIFLQALALSLMLITSILDYVAHDKRTSKFKKNRNALIVLIVLSLIGNIAWTWIDHKKNEKVELHYKTQFSSLKDSLSEIKGISTLLTTQIEPFLKLAEANYPNLPIEEALEELESDILTLKSQTEELKKKENIRSSSENKLEILKRTRPQVNAGLLIDKNLKELVLAIEFQNKVPIKFSYVVKKMNNEVIGGAMISSIELNPKGNNLFHRSHGKINSFDIPFNDPSDVILEFRYSSIYQSEFRNEKLSGIIEKKYRINPANNELVEY